MKLKSFSVIYINFYMIKLFLYEFILIDFKRIRKWHKENEQVINSHNNNTAP